MPGDVVGWPIAVQPVAQFIHPRQRVVRIAVLLPVGAHRVTPLRDLAFQKRARPLPLFERAIPPGRLTKPRHVGGVVQADLMAHRRFGDVGGGDLVARVEAVDLFHEVEDHAHDAGVLARGDEFGVRHATSGQRAQHGDLALHRPVTVGPRVRRRAAQHQLSAVDIQAHHDVLAAAGQWHHIGDLRTDSLHPDPVGERGDGRVVERAGDPRNHGLRHCSGATSADPWKLFAEFAFHYPGGSERSAGHHHPEVLVDHATDDRRAGALRAGPHGLQHRLTVR